MLFHSDNPGGGYGLARGMCIDAAGTVWTVGGDSNAVSEFDSSGNALSPGTGYTGGSPTSTTTHIGIAVDPSGNLWVARYSQYALTEFIGIAAPTRTPIIAAITQGFTPRQPSARITYKERWPPPRIPCGAEGSRWGRRSYANSPKPKP